jgi:hypothetical protein
LTRARFAQSSHFLSNFRAKSGFCSAKLFDSTQSLDML